MQIAQLFDHVDPGIATAGPIDISAFPGVWMNSNPDSGGIARIVMSESAGKLALQVFAIGPDGLIDWGTVDVNVFMSSPSSRLGAGFTCTYDFGFAETRLMGMLAKGLLVLAEVNSFRDESGRSDFFVREYFALDHGRF